MNASWFRAARAYVRHVDASMLARKVRGRELVGRFGRHTRPFGSRRSSDQCVWCDQSTGTLRKFWHRECGQVYLAARGQTHSMGRPIVRRTACVLCGVADAAEIDHALALGVAIRRGDRRSIRRAWWYGNLRWLCRECHASKTRADRRLMRELDAQQLALPI